MGVTVVHDDRSKSFVGGRLRALRLGEGLTVQALASRAGVSTGIVSQIERELANPSLRTLEKISAALKVPLTSLLEDKAEHVDGRAVFVRRRANRPVFPVGPTPIIKELLSPADSYGLRFMIILFPPHSRSADVVRDPGQKAGLVIEGDLQLVVGKQEVSLHRGDSFQFDSTIDHSIRNDTDRAARVLWITAPANIVSGF